MQIDVETAAVTSGRIAARVTVTGTIQAVTTVDVAAPVSGTVSALYADDNATIHAGDVLARLDRAPYEQRLQVARDALAAAQSADADSATIAASEAEVRAATLDLERTIIRSPVDGIVVVRNVDVGQLVTSEPAAPVVYRIAVALDQLQLLADVNPVDVPDVKAGDVATFTVASDARTFSAVITKVGHSIVARVANADRRLRPAMRASVTFAEATRDDAIRIPGEARTFEPRPQARAIVDDAGLVVAAEGDPVDEGVHEVWRYEHGRLTPVAVRIGLSGNGWTELMSGRLLPGDELATGVTARRAAAPLSTWLP